MLAICYPMLRPEDINVRRTRFALIGAGQSGSISAAIPEGATLLTDGGGHFGGLAGVVSQIVDGEPAWAPVEVSGEVVTVTSLDSNGDYSLSADPGGDCSLVFATDEPVTTSKAGMAGEQMVGSVDARGIASGDTLPDSPYISDIFLLETDDGLYVAVET